MSKNHFAISNSNLPTSDIFYWLLKRLFINIEIRRLSYFMYSWNSYQFATLVGIKRDNKTVLSTIRFFSYNFAISLQCYDNWMIAVDCAVGKNIIFMPFF